MDPSDLMPVGLVLLRMLRGWWRSRTAQRQVRSVLAQTSSSDTRRAAAGGAR